MLRAESVILPKRRLDSSLDLPYILLAVILRHPSRMKGNRYGTRHTRPGPIAGLRPAGFWQCLGRDQRALHAALRIRRLANLPR